MNVPRVIYVMGIDGSGKTTVVEWLAKTLKERGHRVDVEWLRFNHVLSKPLLAFCRLTGLTRYETKDGVRVGYHEFHRSRFVAWLFVYLQYLDALRVRLFRIAPKIRQKNSVLILDRFVYDILIDLMIDTGMEDLDSHWIGRAFLDLLPVGTVVLPLVRNRDALLKARPESALDRHFAKRRQLYERLESRQELQILRNDSCLEDFLSRVGVRVGL